MEIGSIVYSKAGRDQGAYYAVVEIVDENTVRIADGNLRHIKNAKLKNVKHLQSTGDTLEKIAEKLKNGNQVFDQELFSALRFYNETTNKRTLCQKKTLSKPKAKSSKFCPKLNSE